VSQTVVERYTLRRLRSIGLIAAACAVIAWWIGYPQMAWGAIGAAPIAMFNYLIVYRVVHEAEREKSRGLRGILLTTLARLAISLLTLWAASRFGIEVMLGALAALVSEMLSYTGDTVRAIISLKRG